MTLLSVTKSALPLVKRIVFLGDSITDEGTFIAYLDAYFKQHLPDVYFTLINLGVSSETVSGLSESDHPFPRPCLHDRLARALVESKPDWVVMGYGMNDAIYSPFSEARFQAYQQGMLQAIQDIQQMGAKAIVMTPPPFDVKSLNEAVPLPDGQEAYSFMTPYAQYNDVLRRYADWVLSLNTEADAVVNLYDPLLQHREQERKLDADFRSGDGVHPNAAGHWVMAKTLLSELFNITVEQEPDYVQHPEESQYFQLIWQRHQLLSSAWKEHVGHTNIHKVDALPLELAKIQGEDMNRRLRMMGM
ncbi:SGNH/GDSL hydrolase family protein [Paenibacillus sp. N3.4]|uniref:SGNH/GDSL hydrolase family protein n=1 Tax=Paenibacillus sp. N3.4 TaxID=2603222 RepID=UPI0011C852C6|nr:SGNH/GDSL hydrolase family protein [Paenibacillus sp. N3.4]TXK80386.1 SGNH/GDSL hydrolase family protein [Paenibacillus sp. N3.4]